MDERIFRLKNPMEDYEYVKFNFVIDEDWINGDLGIFEEQDGMQVFVPKYTSAVVPKSQIENYVED